MANKFSHFSPCMYIFSIYPPLAGVAKSTLCSQLIHAPYTHPHRGKLCSSCAAPPGWRPADGTGPGVCKSQKCGGAGYSRISLEHTQVLFFYPSYITQRTPRSGFTSARLSDRAGLIVPSSRREDKFPEEICIAHGL